MDIHERVAGMRKTRRVRALANDTRGATAVEYGLILAMIVLAMTAALRGVANANTGMWDHVSREVIANS